MQTRRKQFTALLCTAALSLTLLGTAAAAAQQTTVHTNIWYARMYVDDVFVGFQNEQGRSVPAVAYNGTVYIPVRNAGE